jgi:hypothetical protein
MRDRIATWRRWIGAVSALAAFLFLVCACLIYFRYINTYPNPHATEMQQHARTLNLIWRVSFYGSSLSFLLSLVGLGWGRWGGLAMSVAALVFDLMTLGALCGPYGC